MNDLYLLQRTLYDKQHSFLKLHSMQLYCNMWLKAGSFVLYKYNPQPCKLNIVKWYIAYSAC